MVRSGEFYAQDLGPANLELLARFFDKYPEYAERTFLSVKVRVALAALCANGLTVSMSCRAAPGRVKWWSTPRASKSTMITRLDQSSPLPDLHSTQNLRRSVTAVNAALRGTKRLDLFEPARVDVSRPIEDITRDLQALVKEGLFDHIGMSECSAETLRRANAVYPITAVEIEVSPWSYEEETKKGALLWEVVMCGWADREYFGYSSGDCSGTRYRCGGVLVSSTGALVRNED